MDQSGAYNAGHSVGIIIACIVIYGGIIALGVYFGRRLSRRRGDGVAVHWPVGVAVTLILLLLIGQCSTANKARSAPVTAEQGDVVTEQRVYGPAAKFPTNLTAEVVRMYDKGVRDGMGEVLHSRDPSISLTTLTTSTRIVSFSGHMVLKSQIQVPSRMFMYQFAGTSGESIVLVICSSRTAQPFDTAGTECERTAAKLFGA